MAADPKPHRRIVNPAAGLEKVKKEGRCRVTKSPNNLTRFHLVGKDLGGDDVDDNIVPITHGFHMAWEHNPRGKIILGPLIWKRLTKEERQYVLDKKGPDYARRYYGVTI